MKSLQNPYCDLFIFQPIVKIFKENNFFIFPAREVKLL